MATPDPASFLAHVRDRRILWLLHVNADPDCLASAFALQQAFGGALGAPEGVSRVGARLARALGAVVDTWPHPEHFDAVVAVDTSTRTQLGRMGPRVAAPLLVDHHEYGDLQAGAPAAFLDPTRSSCSEVVLGLLAAAGRTPSAEAAFGLLVGLAADTARFRFANAATFPAAEHLLHLSGRPMEDAYALLEGGEDDGEDLDDPSLRKAVLLAAQRAQLEHWGPFLVATSEVGSFDAAAAGALVRLGADVAIVGREKPAQARLSLRASSRAREKGLHLGRVANEAAQLVGWSGGGHEGAAGLNGKPPLAPARAKVLALARAALEEA